MTHSQTQGAEGAGTSLDDRLRAAGMFTIPEMMGETPLTRWQTHAAMTSLDAFEWWLDAQVRQYLTMKAEYEIGDKPKDDELYEWVLAHSGAFHVIRTNFRAAKSSTAAPAATSDVRSLLRTARSGLATYGAGAFEGTIAQIDAILAYDPATPAPATTPGVPDSVRALLDQEPELTSFGINPEGGPDVWVEGTNRFCREDDALEYREWARSLKAAVRTLIAAQPAGQAGDAGEDARTVLTEACKPWEHYTGEPPDDGSPLSSVFVAGMVYTERLLAKLLDVTHYEGGDGSEDFDSDAAQTLRNILAGAGLWDADENCAVKPAPDSTRTGAAETEELREEVAYWRRDLSARLCSLTALYKAALDRGESDRAADLANAIRPALASYHNAEDGEWHERCELCGEFVRDGEPRAAWEDVSGHARCLSEDGKGHVDPHGDEDLARQVEAAQAALDAPWPEAALAARPEAPSDAGYQDRAEKWLAAVTEGDPTDLAERRDRFSEEAMELVQSLGATREGMHELIDYVFDRPVGEPGDEMGDTKLCMANLASWAKLDMDACGEAMLARRSKPESVAKIRRKRSTRHGRGPLPGFTPPSDPAPSGQAEG